VVTVFRRTVRPALAVVLLATACRPSLDQTVSIIGEPTILAVRSDPPEAVPTPPANGVKLTALYVDGSGAVTSAPISWAFCTARNPLANLGPVNPKCVQASGSWFVPLGVGPEVTGDLPNNGCIQFGPQVPQPMVGQPQGRPVDPDPTGGYYQPVRVLAASGAGASITVGETRLSCGLAGGIGNVSADYEKRYHFNVNPKVGSLSLVTSATATTALSPDDQGARNPARAGTHLDLRVSTGSVALTRPCRPVHPTAPRPQLARGRSATRASTLRPRASSIGARRSPSHGSRRGEPSTTTGPGGSRATSRRRATTGGSPPRSLGSSTYGSFCGTIAVERAGPNTPSTFSRHGNADRRFDAYP
jgi:hypothetical protein